MPKEPTKQCRTCGKVFTVSHFQKRKASKDGLQHHCKSCTNTRVRGIRKRNPEYMRQYGKSPAGRSAQRKHLLKAKYGLTIADYDALLESQGGACACCRSTSPRGSSRLHVDHNHHTGKVRGLLCSPCNTGIGLLGDNIQGLKLAINYLQNNDQI